MKKMRVIALFLALCVLLTVPALAAEPIENEKMKVTVVEGAGATVAFDESNDEIINVTVTSALLVPGEQYVVLMVRSDDGVNFAINEESILYIDQTDTAGAVASGSGGSVSFGVYPSEVADSIIMIAGAEDGLLKAAIVNTPEGTFILGDANDDGVVSGLDAVAVLRNVAGLPNTTFNEKAANVDGNDTITGYDAVRLLRFIAFAEALG